MYWYPDRKNKKYINFAKYIELCKVTNFLYTIDCELIYRFFGEYSIIQILLLLVVTYMVTQ